MPKIRFLPMNEICEAETGETILSVALKYQLPMQHACGGFCSCTTCEVEIIDGNFSEPNSDEEDLLETLNSGLNSRLGCQCKILSDCVVEVKNLE